LILATRSGETQPLECLALQRRRDRGQIEGGRVACADGTDAVAGERGERPVRSGGSWNIGASYLAASNPDSYATMYEYFVIGFRVASLVPEPGPGLLGMTAVLGLAAWRKRTAKAL
jgi:MYXO-CTERM domain-containing protein